MTKHLKVSEVPGLDKFGVTSAMMSNVDNRNTAMKMAKLYVEECEKMLQAKSQKSVNR